MAEQGYVYFIKGTLGGKIIYYKGATLNLGRRMKEHINNEAKFTSKMKSKVLIGYFEVIPADRRYTVEYFFKVNKFVKFAFVGKKTNYNADNQKQKFWKWCHDKGISCKYIEIKDGVEKKC